METIMIYLLKMFVCSAVLYGYYRLALYNERFHQWNRFYLLAALVLSAVVPLLHIPLAVPEQTNMTVMVDSLPWNSIKQNSTLFFTWHQLALYACGIVSVVFFARLVYGLLHIVRLYKVHRVTGFRQNISLILTSVKEAPFSFFNWLFWRDDIDPASEDGKRILQHELAHIDGHHSVDKILSSVMLCLFWMNPFFWLVRKELNMIHEFLADRQAIGNRDGAAFANMILQALPATFTTADPLINPFFSSNIKRRLFMITSSHLAKYSYARRLSGLAMMILVVCSLTISVQYAQAQKAAKIQKQTIVLTDTGRIKTNAKTNGQITITTTPTLQHDSTGENMHITIDTLVVNENKTVITNMTGHGKITIRDKTSSGKQSRGTVSTLVIKSDNLSLDRLGNDLLYMIEGKKATVEQIRDLEPNTIQAVNVFKGASAIELFGEEGKNGVVEISLKKEGNKSQPPVSLSIDQGGKKAPANPLYILNGKQISKDEMNELKPNDIESINVLKGEKATGKYGDKGKDGVIEIIMKKPITYNVSPRPLKGSKAPQI